MNSADSSNGTLTVATPFLIDDSINSASKRVFAMMIQIDAIVGVPALR